MNHLSILTDRSLNNETNLIQLKHPSKLIYVIGVSHNSRVSSYRVESAINDLWPDTIFLELCEKRLNEIRVIMALQSPILNKLRKLIHKLSRYSLCYKYKHGPFIEAIHASNKKKLNLICGDINSAIVLNQLRYELELQRFRELSYRFNDDICNNADESENISIMSSFFDSIKTEYMWHMKFLFKIGDSDIINVYKERRMLQRGIEKTRVSARDIVDKYSKEIYRILHEQRDEYMVHQLNECVGDIIVAVVGIGHLDGIQKCWKQLHCHTVDKYNDI